MTNSGEFLVNYSGEFVFTNYEEQPEQNVGQFWGNSLEFLKKVL